MAFSKTSAMLADDFDVAGTATDGREALRAARDIDPDVIVLDINMPGLDGFQTCRALQQQGSRARIVFLSLFEDDELMNEAFRCGGRGYVVKSQITRDLASAVDQVLAGRLFAPSLMTLFGFAEGRGHAMHVHGEEKAFLDGLAAAFEQALRRGDATCVIATEDVRGGVAERLRARGWSLEPSPRGRYLEIDAYDAMKRFMRRGHPDATLLDALATELDQYRSSVAQGPAPRLTVFGNMVTPLIVEGNSVAAVELENLWNKSTQGLRFLTLCGYATSCFKDGERELWSRVCAEHEGVSHSLSV